jgi:DnaJ-domain-containing protein 1
MDKFFDRLGDLLQSLLGGETTRSGTYDLRDPDMREAVEELDAFLESGTSQRRTAGSGGFGPRESRDYSYDGRSRGRQERWKAKPVEEALRKDYATLEVAFTAPLAEVRRSYKRLLHKYHPDRFSGDEEKQTLANEVTQRLNEAFARIERQHKSHP